MVVAADITVTGLLAWLAEHPGTVTDAQVRGMTRKAQRRALTEWSLGGRSELHSLAGRGQARAMQALRLTARTSTYMARVRRRYGRYLPYRSPRGGGHMMDRLSDPGVGWRLTARNGQADVTTVLKLPGARVLNRLGADGAAYRRELLDWQRDPISASRIEARVAELLREQLAAKARTARRRHLGGKRRR